MKKLIKRGFAALLALTLALGMSVSAFAIEGTAEAKAVAQKDYQLTNPDTKSPEETFTFTATAKGATDATNPNGSAVTTADMPHLTITVDKYNEGEAGSADCKHDLVVTPDKDFPSVGIYTYDVTETKGDTGRLQRGKAAAEGHGFPRCRNQRAESGLRLHNRWEQGKRPRQHLLRRCSAGG